MLNENLNRIARFPKVNCLLAGTFLKFCFCKGTCFPIVLLPAFSILVYYIWSAPKKRDTFFLGYCFGLGYFSSTLYWIAESFKCVGLGNYGYISVAALVLYISLYPALACLFAKCFSKNKVSFSISFPVFWVIFEYVRGFLFTGFPWNLIGYAAYEIPYFSQVADVFGVYGVSFLVLLITLLLTSMRTVIYAVLLFGVVCSYGVYKVRFFDGYIESAQRAPVTLVQPSISQEDKMNLNKFKNNIDRHLGLFLKNEKVAKIYGGTRLVIWPEAAINSPVVSEDPVLTYIASAIAGSSRIIISGCDRYDSERKLYNSVYVFGSDAKVIRIYDKRHLLPFGEYIPEFLKVCGLRKVASGITNFSEGTHPRTISLPNLDPFDIVICYEIAFPGEIVDNSDSSWILNITNDSWFKDSDGPTQHMKMACFRAIEEGRSVARCANNGISCIIDCHGNIKAMLKTDEIGTIDEMMPLKWCRTIYSRYKNKPMFVMLSFAFGISLLLGQKRKVRRLITR